MLPVGYDLGFLATYGVKMRGLAVTVFGVLPASALCFFVLPASIYFVGEYFDNGEAGILVTIVWSVFAVIGTFALFFSIDSPPGPVRIVGLCCGVVAMYGLDGFSQIGPSAWSLFFIGPVVTAIFLIIEGLHSISTGDGAPDYWSH